MEKRERVLELLKKTFEPETQGQADAELRDLSQLSGFSRVLLQICADKAVGVQLRQSSAIFLKNLIRKRWTKAADDGSTENPPIDTADKVFVRLYIFGLIRNSCDLIKRQLLDIVKTIIVKDADDENVAAFTGQIIGSIAQTNDPLLALTGVQVFHELVNCYQFRNPSSGTGVFLTLGRINNDLLRLIQSGLQASDHDLSFKILHICFKTFRRCIQFDLPLKEIRMSGVGSWIDLCCLALRIATPDRISQTEEAADPSPEKHPYWRTVKWAAAVLNHIMDKFGRPKVVRKVYGPFSIHFLNAYGEKLVGSCLPLIVRYGEGKFVPDRCVFEVVMMLAKGLSCNRIWDYLKPFFPVVLTTIISGSLGITEFDEDLISSDPIQFLTMRQDLECGQFSTNYAASFFVRIVAHKRYEGLVVLVNWLSSLFDEYPQLSATKKESILTMLGLIASTLLERRTVDFSKLQDFLINYILNDLRSDSPCVRFRVLWVINAYRSLPFTIEVVRLLAGQACRVLFDSSGELVAVRVQAATLLVSFLAKHKIILKPDIDSNIKPIVRELLQLIRESEYDGSPRLLRDFIKLIGNEVSEIADEVTAHLGTTYVQLVASSDAVRVEPEPSGPGTDESKAMAIMEINQALCIILSSLDPATMASSYAKVESNVISVINYVLVQTTHEFISDVYELVFELTSRQISEQCWSIYVLWCRTALQYSGESFTEMLPSFQNYVNVGSSAIFEHNRYLVMVEMCEELIRPDLDSRIAEGAAKLVEAVVLQSAKIPENDLRFDRRQLLVRVIAFFGEKFFQPDKYRSSLIGTALLNILAVLFVDQNVFVATFVNGGDSTLPVFLQFLEHWICRSIKFARFHGRLMTVLGLARMIELSALAASLKTDTTKNEHKLAAQICSDLQAILPQFGAAISGCVIELKNSADARERIRCAGNSVDSEPDSYDEYLDAEYDNDSIFEDSASPDDVFGEGDDPYPEMKCPEDVTRSFEVLIAQESESVNFNCHLGLRTQLPSFMFPSGLQQRAANPLGYDTSAVGWTVVG